MAVPQNKEFYMVLSPNRIIDLEICIANKAFAPPRLETLMRARNILPAHQPERFSISGAHNQCNRFLAAHLKRQEVHHFRLFSKILKSDKRKNLLEALEICFQFFFEAILGR